MTPLRLRRPLAGGIAPLAALAVALVLAAPAARAQDASLEAKRSLAERIYVNSLSDQIASLMVNNIWTSLEVQLRQMARSQNKTVKPQGMADLRVLFMKTVREGMEEQRQTIIDAFAAEMSLDELEFLDRFYTDPRARSAMEKMPALMSRLQPAIQASMPARVQEMLQQVDWTTVLE